MKLINVLATGPSLNRYIKSEETTVGVNKIIISHDVDHLVCIDVPDAFPPFVIKKFQLGNYKKFYTHLYDQWRNIIPRDTIQMELTSIRGQVDLNTDKYSFSISSPFVAVVVAYKLGATIIDLYGADYNDHPSFTSTDTIDKIKKDFFNLQQGLLEHDVSI